MPTMSANVTVRFTAEELEAIDRAAEAARETRHAFMHRAIVERAQQNDPQANPKPKDSGRK